MPRLRSKTSNNNLPRLRYLGGEPALHYLHNHDTYCPIVNAHQRWHTIDTIRITVSLFAFTLLKRLFILTENNYPHTPTSPTLPFYLTHNKILCFQIDGHHYYLIELHSQTAFRPIHPRLLHYP